MLAQESRDFGCVAKHARQCHGSAVIVFPAGQDRERQCEHRHRHRAGIAHGFSTRELPPKVPIDGTRRGRLENRGERRAISIVERSSEQRPDGRVVASRFGSRSRGETLLGKPVQRREWLRGRRRGPDTRVADRRHRR